MKSLKLVENPKLWFMGTALGLMGLHINLTSRFGTAELLSISVLFWSAVLYRLWKKSHSLSVEVGVFSRFIGIILIIVVLLKSIFIYSNDPFLKISPFISVLGLGIFSSGIKKLKQYQQELFILFVLVIPIKEVLSQLVDVATLTAKFATSLLWLLGFDVSRQGVYINLPTGVVEVIPGCDGRRSMARMLQIAVFF